MTKLIFSAYRLDTEITRVQAKARQNSGGKIGTEREILAATKKGVCFSPTTIASRPDSSYNKRQC